MRSPTAWSAIAPKRACLGPVPGAFGTLQALLTLKILLQMPGQLDGELLLLDFMNFSSLKLKAPRRAECRAPGCAHHPRARARGRGHRDRAATRWRRPRSAASTSSIFAPPRKFAARPDRGTAHPHARAAGESRPARRRAPGTLLVCASGKRSLAAARELRKRGLAVRSLAGGLQDSGGAEVRFNSKLPEVGTTIFTVMSRRALEEGALNIGQGFPDYAIDPRLAASLIEVIGEGRNQYAPMEGVMELREQIAPEAASAATAPLRSADRDHGHLRRHRGAVRRHPSGGGPGR